MVKSLYSKVLLKHIIIYIRYNRLPTDIINIINSYLVYYDMNYFIFLIKQILLNVKPELYISNIILKTNKQLLIFNNLKKLMIYYLYNNISYKKIPWYKFNHKKICDNFTKYEVYKIDDINNNKIKICNNFIYNKIYDNIDDNISSFYYYSKKNIKVNKKNKNKNKNKNNKKNKNLKKRDIRIGQRLKSKLNKYNRDKRNKNEYGYENYIYDKCPIYEYYDLIDKYYNIILEYDVYDEYIYMY
jgi:hypothetical protein